uniref:Uncharacterized protein n=1 Tax=Macrostomum lignano TaxID=282301 RepID=A0A1I8JMH2_9PLAT
MRPDFRGGSRGGRGGFGGRGGGGGGGPAWRSRSRRRHPSGRRGGGFGGRAAAVSAAGAAAVSEAGAAAAPRVDAEAVVAAVAARLWSQNHRRGASQTSGHIHFPRQRGRAGHAQPDARRHGVRREESLS